MKPTIVKKTVTAQPGILEQIFQKRKAFMRRWGKAPAGVLLGPLEYLACLQVYRDDPRARFSAFHGGDVVLGYPDEVMGMKIHLKPSRGVEMEIALQDVLQHAAGVIEEITPP